MKIKKINSLKNILMICGKNIHFRFYLYPKKLPKVFANDLSNSKSSSLKVPNASDTKALIASTYIMALIFFI